MLSREMKQRRDSLTEFEKADRTDLAEKSKVKLQLLKNTCRHNLMKRKFAKSLLVRSKNRSFFSEGIRKSDGRCDASSKGKADGNQVNAIVKELLGQGHAVSILLDAYGFLFFLSEYF